MTSIASLLICNLQFQCFQHDSRSIMYQESYNSQKLKLLTQSLSLFIALFLLFGMVCPVFLLIRIQPADISVQFQLSCYFKPKLEVYTKRSWRFNNKCWRPNTAFQSTVFAFFATPRGIAKHPISLRECHSLVRAVVHKFQGLNKVIFPVVTMK